MTTDTQAELIARIADETQTPLEEVQRNYLAEWQDLSTDARIRDYLPVFVVRRVKAMLRRRDRHHQAQ
jgi:hypothetical protein